MRYHKHNMNWLESQTVARLSAINLFINIPNSPEWGDCVLYMLFGYGWVTPQFRTVQYENIWSVTNSNLIYLSIPDVEQHHDGGVELGVWVYALHAWWSVTYAVDMLMWCAALVIYCVKVSIAWKCYLCYDYIPFHLIICLSYTITNNTLNCKQINRCLDFRSTGKKWCKYALHVLFDSLNALLGWGMFVQFVDFTAVELLIVTLLWLRPVHCSSCCSNFTCMRIETVISRNNNVIS